MVLDKTVITVIYYTSNREQEAFESKIQERLLDAIDDLPLVSISQKPIDFGKNICMGNIGASDINILKQLLIGCETANTPLIATTEADCLYPPIGYFDFRPDDIDRIYRYTNLWVLGYGWSCYRKKAYSLCAQVSGREYLIHCIKERLQTEKARGDIVHKKELVFFKSKLPCINIKTGYGMRSGVGTDRNSEPKETLPYWGPAVELKEKLGV